MVHYAFQYTSHPGLITVDLGIYMARNCHESHRISLLYVRFKGQHVIGCPIKTQQSWAAALAFSYTSMWGVSKKH